MSKFFFTVELLLHKSIKGCSLKTLRELASEPCCQFTNEEYGQRRKNIWNYLVYALNQSV